MVVQEIAQHVKENPEGIAFNMSRRFLSPSLSLYPEIKGTFVNLHLIATAVWDDMYGDFETDYFFMLFSRTPVFLERLKKIRLLDWYRDDYPADNISERRLHMVVVKLPVKDSVVNFLNGDFSKMYDPKTAYSIFIERYANTRHNMKLWFSRSYMTCMKQEERRFQFQEEVNEWVNSIGARKGHEPYHPGTELIIPPELEYDVKPDPASEIFNYGEETIYYNSFLQRIQAIPAIA